MSITGLPVSQAFKEEQTAQFRWGALGAIDPWRGRG